MNNNQIITTIAGKYANRCDNDFDAYKSAKAFLLWLCDDFCLVEKDKVVALLKSAMQQQDAGTMTRNTTTLFTGVGKEVAVCQLFPEIAKEVEK